MKKKGKKIRTKRGICPKCGVKGNLTRHHILPKRFFHGEGDTMLICRLCHDELENKIPFKIRLTEDEYYLILDKFLRKGEKKHEEKSRRQR